VGEQEDDAASQPDRRRCAHCGRSFAVRRGPGRPARYCRRSCRQRAFEHRRHAGDQAWSDARLVELAERLARHEDAIDRVAGLLEQLRADLEAGVPVDAQRLVEHLGAALRLVEEP
jgi:hypothetical protein